MKHLSIIILTMTITACASKSLKKQMLENPALTEKIIIENPSYFTKIQQKRESVIDSKLAQKKIKKQIAEYKKKSKINKKKLKVNNQFPLNRILKDIKTKRMINLAKLEKKPILIEFWASWCLPCIAKMETINRLHGTFGDKITVLGINVREKSVKNAKKVIKKNKMSFLNLEDKKNSFVTEFGNIPLPTTILLNSTGKIIKVNIGFDDKVDEEKELAKEIKKLL